MICESDNDEYTACVWALEFAIWAQIWGVLLGKGSNSGNMKIDAGYEGDLAKISTWGQRVEASGRFHGMWVSDTTNDPFVLATLLASSTEKLQIGTSIAVAFSRSPYVMAQTAYNLSQLSQGRFHLGLGTQVKAHIQKRFSMPWPDKPVTALKEYVSLLRHLFDCFEQRTRPQYRGDFFSCTLNSPVFTPDHHDYGSPPVGFSAVGRKASVAAGEIADSVFLHPFTHLKYLKEVSLPALSRGSEERPSRLKPLIKIGATFLLATDAPDFRFRQKQVLGRLAFYASTPNYKAVVDSAGPPGLHEELHRLSRQGEWEKMALALPPDFVKQCVVIAPKAQLEDALRERFDTIYDRVVVDATVLL